MTRSRILMALSLGLAVAGLTGCSDDLGAREEVSGMVRLGGEPLDNGAIEFTPLEPAEPGQMDTKSGAPLVQGRYTIPRANGLAPGKYRVRITAANATDGPKPGELPGPSGPPAKERVPAKFNTQSELEATVTSSGPNTFDFEIP
jgi:hypothetical protein